MICDPSKMGVRQCRLCWKEQTNIHAVFSYIFKIYMHGEFKSFVITVFVLSRVQIVSNVQLLR
jgi:hypothetical protein